MFKMQYIIIALLIFVAVSVEAEDFNDIMIFKQIIEAGEKHDDVQRTLLDSQIMLRCEQQSNSSILKCFKSDISVYRENPKNMTVWKLVDRNGKLTKEGLDAYDRVLNNECKNISSMSSTISRPNPEFIDFISDLQKEVNDLKELCSSKEAAALKWSKDIKEEASTCSIIKTYTPEITFKQVGNNKWIRSIGDDDLETLTYSNLFKDGNGRGWIYTMEGSRDVKKNQPWKYNYKGISTIPRGFQLNSLSSCKKIYFE